jgi:AbrB family looped-hinge helix DNA binding protein
MLALSPSEMADCFSMETSVDKSGRVLLPKRLRGELRLHPGSKLVVERHDEEVRLRPLRHGRHLVSKGGVLVFTGVPVGDVAQAVHRHRNERARAVARRGKK